ncbi:MAG: hypothetical protein DWQ49_08885 [Bacteroidetes bacterium]|nr:MAG: hypothetical protein DWQ49_08885 [Bacteroidota bacterium]
MGYYFGQGWAYELLDADRDTGIEVEQTPDDDVIRGHLGGATPITNAFKWSQSDGFHFNTTEVDLDFKVSGQSREYGIWWDASANNGYVHANEQIQSSGGPANIKWLVGRADADDSVNMGSITYSDTTHRGSIFFGARARGVEGSPTVVSTNDVLFQFSGLGHGATEFRRAGEILVECDATPTGNSVPGRVVFKTTPVGSNSPDEKMRIENDGIVVNESGSGYGWRMEGSTDENLMYNDGSNDTMTFGNNITEVTANGGTVVPKVIFDRSGGNSNINAIFLSNIDQDSAGAFCTFARARGSSVSQTTFQAVQTSDRLGVFRNDAHDGTEFVTSALVQFEVDGTVSTGVVPTRIMFYSMDSTGSIEPKMKIASSGRTTFENGGNDQIILYEEGGMRGNLQSSSSGLAQLIWRGSGSNTQLFRVNPATDEVTIGTNTNGNIAFFDSSKVHLNRFHNDIDFIVDGATNNDVFKVYAADEIIQTNGGRIKSIRRVATGPYTVVNTDEVIFVDTDSAAITINLQAGVNGRTLRIVNVGSSGNDVTVDGNGSENVKGATTNAITDGNEIIITYQATEGWW